MGGFLKTLAKVGLVELDGEEQATVDAEADMSDDEARRIIAEAAGRGGGDAEATTPQAPAAPAADPSPPLVDLPADTNIDEGLPFDTLYQLAQVKDSPFSAEKLLRLLEGLKVMDMESRKTAVKAMDAADDSWTIGDPIIDAQRKIEALGAGKRKLAKQVADQEAAVAAELKAQDEYAEKATAQIRQQIAELEELLQKELEKVADERATANAQLKATREAATRETARLDGEIARLGEITNLFSPLISEPEPGSQ